ncbi:MAG TPA: GNAT family N-acetyltransferase [Thermoanaerobaculia bacterium]|nr:GNAT family N-acetyltransferase [Thermoanaerobaculia bacterium]
MIETAAYPTRFEADVVLRNGRTLHVRPILPEDRERLLHFYRRLSEESLHSRFFDLRTPERALESSPTSVDFARIFGLIAESGAEIVGVAHYFSRRSGKEAEVAFAIADRLRECGAGTKLLEILVESAREHDIERFTAEVLPENRAMLSVFFGVGFEVTSRTSDGTVRLSFPIAPTARATELAAARSQTAAHASMNAIFAPHSIAVIGASRRPEQLGHAIVRNLRTAGFCGPLYVVNPNATDIEGVPAFRSLQQIAGPVELGIIAVPAELVEGAIEDCIDKGVSAVVVITAGFAETGEEGAGRERRLMEKIRTAGIRMVGPNCMGVLNTDPAVRMHATFAPVFPPAGTVAMSSQSGALGLAVLDYARSLNIGFSTFISVGNKADVSGNDLIQYWAEDPKTEVILLYLESFGNPRKFGEIARRVGRKKPIVAVKAGRSAGGAKAASSHTGALATSDAVVDDLFRRAGVIRTETLEEMFDVAALLAHQPLPKGRRVAVLTNAGGPGILAADACEANGLALAQLSEETVSELRSFLPAAASVGNPVDMIASASAEQYRRALSLLGADPNVDAVIAIYIPVSPKGATDVACAIREGAQAAHDKTILSTFMSAAGTPPALAPVPAFAFPERAVGALAHVAQYAEWRARPSGEIREFNDIDEESLRSIVDASCARGGGWLHPLEVAQMLRAARIAAPPSVLALSAEHAAAAARGLEFPVALKASGPELLHKSEFGAVRLGLADEDAVREAFVSLAGILGDKMTGALVQPMIAGGVEMMLGATFQASFGHLIACGAGGTLVELLHDVALRMHPLTDRDAEELLAGLRCAPLLRGFRGSAPVDAPALQEAILRLSALLSICPEIQEIDLNPLKVLEEGVSALDARIRVAPAACAPPSRRVAY